MYDNVNGIITNVIGFVHAKSCKPNGYADVVASDRYITNGFANRFTSRHERPRKSKF